MNRNYIINTKHKNKEGNIIFDGSYLGSPQTLKQLEEGYK